MLHSKLKAFTTIPAPGSAAKVLPIALTHVTKHPLTCRAVQVSSPAQASLDYEPCLLSVAETCKEIRQRLCSNHVAGGLAYAAGGGLVKRNGDVFYKFRPNSNFAYLTGCEEPDSAILIDTETGVSTLLLPKQEADAAFWTGPQPTLEQVAETSGVDRVSYTSDLPSLIGPGQQVHLSCEEDLSHLSRMMGKANSGNSGGSGLRVLDSVLPPVIQRLRSLKTESEVACLLHASRVSGAAHVDTWRACRPGMSEYQLEAVFTASCMTRGLQALGYPCIVGAGRNAAILHYETNRCKVGADDLVLIDAGAEFRCYTADITRTFPASGRFTPQQRDVYQAVLDAQTLALSKLAQGVIVKEVDAEARRLMVARLQDLGLLSRSATMDALMAAGADRVFMPHGLSHFLGLDVHDVSDTGPVPKAGLQPGHVITIEPGCYFIDTLLARAATNPDVSPLLCWDVIHQFQGVGGVRIEDNVAILPAGRFNLTEAAGVPKAVADIEALMGQSRA